MNIQPLSVFPVHARHPDRGFGSLFRDLASKDKFCVHHLTCDPALADVILFLDLNEMADDVALSELRRHPLVQRYRERCFVYCENDQPWCAMQGLYVSMPRRPFQPNRQRACGYIAHSMNGKLDIADANRIKPDLLFSFMGRSGNAAREAVMRLQHRRGVVKDTSQINFFGDRSPESEALRDQFASLVYRSKFILCPRGSGTSSYRLFEAMQGGRVPVIVSDDWVAPAGPDWKSFSVSCFEEEVVDIPHKLETIESMAAEMGSVARITWQNWFAPDALFHRMVEECRSIMISRTLPESLYRYRPSLRLWRLRVRSMKSRFA